jgi:hypothetical protein
VALDLADLRAVIMAAGFEFVQEARGREDWGTAPSMRGHDFPLVFFHARLREAKTKERPARAANTSVDVQPPA